MYCLGDTTELREKKGEGVIVCNNDELAPTIKSASKKASQQTDGEACNINNITINRRKRALIPFGTFTILEYVRYSRALVEETQMPRQAVLERIKFAGLKRKLTCKLKKLSPVEYRALCFASKVDDKTHSAYINFEGLKYCKKHRASLKKFLELLGQKYKVYAMVNDVRFIPKNTDGTTKAT